VEDNNLKKEVLKNIINEANKEVEATNYIKERYGHISI